MAGQAGAASERPTSMTFPEAGADAASAAATRHGEQERAMGHHPH